jgi:hypothetical protein
MLADNQRRGFTPENRLILPPGGNLLRLQPVTTCQQHREKMPG